MPRKTKVTVVEVELEKITSANEAHVDLLLPHLVHTFLVRKQQGYILTQDDADGILDNAITMANQVIERRDPGMKK